LAGAFRFGATLAGAFGAALTGAFRFGAALAGALRAVGLAFRGFA
jgi:hypothetical protein